MKKLVGLAAVVLALTLPYPTPASAGAAADKSGVEVRRLLEGWEKAFRAKDIDGVMAVYAPGAAIVAYDVVPPLAIVGNKAYRKSYEDFFAMYEGSLDFEFRDLRIVADRDVAFIHSLERVSGTLKDGQKSQFWIRATSGLRKIKGRWLIVHDHISAPVDFVTGKAALDLKP